MNEINRQNYPSILQSFGILGIMLITEVCFIPVDLYAKKIFGKELTMLIFYTLSMGVPALIVYCIRKRKVGIQNMNFLIPNIRILPFVIFGVFALLIGIVSPIVNSIPVPDAFKKIFIELGKMNGPISFLTMVIIAPIIEELVFRGFILDGLLRRYSPLKSILVSSLIFGLAHFNPWQFVTGFLCGIFIGWVYLHTRSISVAIIMHASNNLLGFVLGSFMDTEALMNATTIEIYGGLINLIIAIVGSVLVFAVCMYYLKIEFKKLEPLVQNSPIDIPLTDQN